MANLKPSKAVGNLRLNGSLIDNKNFSGFSGGLLKSTGTDTVWDFGGIAIVNLETETSTDPTSVTIDDIAVGDLVLFFGAEFEDNQDQPDGGWTAIPGLQSQPDNDDNPNSAAYYKISTGTSETAGDLSGDNPTYIMIALRGVDTTTPFDVNSVENSASSGLPNSPSITTVTDGCLILSVGIIDDDNVAETILQPTGYERIKIFQDEGTSGNDVGGNTIAISGKQQFIAGSEDPPAFTGSSSDANKGYTIALRPKLPSVSGGGGTPLPYIKCVGDPSSNTRIDNNDSNDTYFIPTWLNITPVFSSGSWIVTTSTIEVPNDGLYLITVNWELTTTPTTNDRLGPQVAIAINGTPNEYVSAHTYMRATGGHGNTSSNQSTLMELDSGDLVSVQWLEHTVNRNNGAADTDLTEDSSFIEIIQLK